VEILYLTLENYNKFCEESYEILVMKGEKYCAFAVKSCEEGNMSWGNYSGSKWNR